MSPLTSRSGASARAAASASASLTPLGQQAGQRVLTALAQRDAGGVGGVDDERRPAGLGQEALLLVGADRVDADGRSVREQAAQARGGAQLPGAVDHQDDGGVGVGVDAAADGPRQLAPGLDEGGELGDPRGDGVGVVADQHERALAVGDAGVRQPAQPVPAGLGPGGQQGQGEVARRVVHRELQDEPAQHALQRLGRAGDAEHPDLAQVDRRGDVVDEAALGALLGVARRLDDDAGRAGRRCRRAAPARRGRRGGAPTAACPAASRSAAPPRRRAARRGAAGSRSRARS